jgi:hypothetical protein
MADISYSMTLKVDKGNLSNQVSVNGVTASMAAIGLQSQTLTLSTSQTSISTSNLSSVGMAFLRNLSTATAATCSVGILAGGSLAPFCTLRPGEPAIVRLAQGVVYGATGTAGGLLRVDITEG